MGTCVLVDRGWIRFTLQVMCESVGQTSHLILSVPNQEWWVLVGTKNLHCTDYLQQNTQMLNSSWRRWQCELNSELNSRGYLDYKHVHFLTFIYFTLLGEQDEAYVNFSWWSTLMGLEPDLGSNLYLYLYLISVYDLFHQLQQIQSSIVMFSFFFFVLFCLCICVFWSLLNSLGPA